MTDSQENLTQIYGWLCFALFLFYVFGVFGHQVLNFFKSLWKGVYEVRINISQHFFVVQMCETLIYPICDVSESKSTAKWF